MDFTIFTPQWQKTRLGPGSGGLSTISRRFNTACGQIITLRVVVGGVRAALVVVVGWLAG